jgi:hypothetical protein
VAASDLAKIASELQDLVSKFNVWGIDRLINKTSA